MKLTVLGCAGSFPGPDAPCSAYLVEADGFRLLLDFGTGSLAVLQQLGALHDLDAVLLSHLHCDHMLDACSYVVVRRYAPDGPYPVLPLYGPTGVRERITAVYGAPDEGPIDDVYDCHTLRPGTRRIGPFEVTLERVNHPVETYGVRLSHGGRTLAYSADTGMCEALLRLADKADVFLCEASYLDGRQNPPDLHLTGGEAGSIATKAGVGRLLLTHLVQAWGDPADTLDSATTTFAGPVALATPRTSYDI
ncbi:MAG TPA: MBL fold metallo-hydrolase [Rugosimonospora sp.]|nr:MBL fold metallo-hydrolase [Rugosimonospora sp.]